MALSAKISTLLVLGLAFYAQAQLKYVVDECKMMPETCVSIPANCLSDSSVNCTAAVMIMPKENSTSNSSEYTFWLATNQDNDYIALGFSNDTSMGGEATVDCVTLGGAVEVVGSSNTGHSHTQGTTGNTQIKVIKTGNDGGPYCTFEIEGELTVAEYNPKFIAGESSYYLLVAVGKVNETSLEMQRHSARMASDLFEFNSAGTTTLTLASLVVAIISKCL